METKTVGQKDEDLLLESVGCNCNFLCCILIVLLLLIFSCYVTYFYSTSDLYSSLILINDNGVNSYYDYRHKLHKYYDIDIDDGMNNTYIRLMSFNLRNKLLDIDDLDEYKHWDLRKNVVYHLLNNIESDIIGTQEGVFSQIEDISYHLHKKYGYYGLGRLPREWYLSSLDRMNEHCTVFWNKQKFIIYDQGTFWLSDEPNIIGSIYPNSYLPRIATWILFEIRNNNKYRILFISTHLGLSSEIREGQIKLITKFIHKMINEQKTMHEKELLVFIVGDFNEALYGELWNNLFVQKNNDNNTDDDNDNDDDEDEVNVSDVLTDCVMEWEKLENNTLNINITYHGFEGIEHIKTDTNHAPIDWILCSKNVIENDDIILLDVYIITKTRIDYKYNDNENHLIYPSDHFLIETNGIR